MAASTVVRVLGGVEHTLESGDRLALQNCRYVYGDGSIDEGYRFIWRDPEGRHQAHRGQARIPSKKIMMDLVERAADQGWLV